MTDRYNDNNNSYYYSYGHSDRDSNNYSYNRPASGSYDFEKERREAIEAGERALDSLRCAQDQLNSARNWGLWDLFGGGFISTMIKHSKMDNARQYIDQARYELRRFSRELEDVNMSCNLNLQTDDFLSFADWFFDGFAVDFMVQDRINRARGQVAEACRRVERILDQLYKMSV